MDKSAGAVIAITVAASIMSQGIAREAPVGVACVERFDNVATLAQHGWLLRNNSQPIGVTGWFQGDPLQFGAYSGEPDSYVSADADNASGNFPVISNWLITPEIAFGPNAFSSHAFAFYTKATPGAPNRVVVRLCLEDANTECLAPGPDSGDLGGFQTTLLTINPEQTLQGYPLDWTQFTITPVDGLPVVGRGRLAFHYYTFWQPPDLSPGSVIGIDDVSMSGATVCPFSEAVFVDGFE